MGKKEKKLGMPTLCLTAPAALAVYLLLQLVNALLVSREVVGEGNAPLLVYAAAGIAVLLSVTLLGRREHSGRLALGLGTAGFFAAAVLLLSFAGAERGGQLRHLPWILLAALLGGLAAACLGGGNKRKKRAAARRR